MCFQTKNAKTLQENTASMVFGYYVDIHRKCLCINYYKHTFGRTNPSHNFNFVRSVLNLLVSFDEPLSDGGGINTGT